MSHSSSVLSRIPARHLFRVTTLNINHHPAELERRTGLACDELGVLAPEVLCLQEVTFEPDGTSAQLETITAATGLTVVSALAQSITEHGNLSGNAILSRLPKIESGSIVLGGDDTKNRAAYAVLQATTGQAVIIVSAHLAWGGDREHRRLAQMTAIDGRVRALVDRYKDRHPVAFLAGDFNALPDSDTHRYLTGLGAGANGGYTHWTGAFEAVGSPADAAVTVAADNHWAQVTARMVGIEFPELLPDRRIDFLYAYGWVYGRPGCPVALRRSFTDTTRYGFPASDHYGLTVDFWTPPVPGADVTAAAGHDKVAPTGQLAIVPLQEPALV